MFRWKNGQGNWVLFTLFSFSHGTQFISKQCVEDLYLYSRSILCWFCGAESLKTHLSICVVLVLFFYQFSFKFFVIFWILYSINFHFIPIGNFFILSSSWSWSLPGPNMTWFLSWLKLGQERHFYQTHHPTPPPNYKLF